MTRIDLHFPAGKDAEKALMLAGYNAKVKVGRMQSALEKSDVVETANGPMRRVSLLSIPYDAAKAIRDTLDAQNHPCELIFETQASRLRNGEMGGNNAEGRM